MTPEPTPEPLLEAGPGSKPQIPAPCTIRIELPYHLRTLAHIQGQLRLTVPPPATIRIVLDTLEAQYPMLRGTIRDRTTGHRRPFLRFFACQHDLSHQSLDDPLPIPVLRGTEPLIILGAVAGG